MVWDLELLVFIEVYLMILEKKRTGFIDYYSLISWEPVFLAPPHQLKAIGE